ncbi:hypothetical protein LMG33818_000029 [Halomonadaceae bacterium LMG 33818]|uniref:phage holin n=1 Tax=Cernens ardua TaxID=3402176 RepID=UPI003EDBF354
MNVMPGQISTAASYCTSGALACGGFVGTFAHEVSTWNWSTITMIGGAVIALATYLTNTYFRRKDSKAYRAALARGKITPPTQD